MIVAETIYRRRGEENRPEKEELAQIDSSLWWLPRQFEKGKDFIKEPSRTAGGYRKGMVRAVRIHSLSGTYAVQYEDIRVPPPPELHVEIRHTAIVASSCDQLAREGQLKGYIPEGSSPKYPFTLGLMGVGVITEVGSGLLDYQIGQRVCYVTAAEPGSFSEQRVILAKYLVPVPAFLTDEQTASVLFEV